MMLRNHNNVRVGMFEVDNSGFYVYVTIIVIIAAVLGSHRTKRRSSRTSATSKNMRYLGLLQMFGSGPEGHAGCRNSQINL